MGKDQRSKQHGLDIRRNRKEREQRLNALMQRDYTPEVWAKLDPAPPLRRKKR